MSPASPDGSTDRWLLRTWCPVLAHDSRDDAFLCRAEVMMHSIGIGDGSLSLHDALQRRYLQKAAFGQMAARTVHSQLLPEGQNFGVPLPTAPGAK